MLYKINHEEGIYMTIDELKEISGWDYLDKENPSNKDLNEELYSTLKNCEIRREIFEVGLGLVEDGIGTMVITKDIGEFRIAIGGEKSGFSNYSIPSDSDDVLDSSLKDIREKIEKIKIRKDKHCKNQL